MKGRRGTETKHAHNFVDLTGQKFGKLTVIEYVSDSKWKCRCECGNEAIVHSCSLRRGHTKSCGCYQRQQTSAALKKHGMRHERIYHVWLDIKNRCNNPRYKRYYDWGGRGITVCEEWQENFTKFYEHVSMLPNYGKTGYSLDRIDNDKGYMPGNVRWATISEQNSNKRVTIKVVYRNQEIPLIQIAEMFNIKYATLLFHYHKKDLDQYLERRVNLHGIDCPAY